MRFHWLLLLLFTLPALAADPPKHRADGDAAVAARRVLLEHCSACHGDPDKQKRQGRLYVSDWTTLVGNAGDSGPISFVSLDKDDFRSQVLEFMTDGSMPPGGRKPVPKEQIAAVESWVKRGSPEYPTLFDDDTVLRLIGEDIGRVEKEKSKEYVQHVRYVSLAHLVDKKGADLATAEAELLTALAGRTHADQIRLTKARQEVLKKLAKGTGTPQVLGKALRPVAGSAGTVYRLDLKELGWDGGGKLLFEWTKSGTAEGEFRMKPFDLIQLEYPYSHTPTDDGRKKAADAAVAAMNAHRNKTGAKDPLAQLRAVPFVRGDWLAKALWQNDKPTPLADDLDSLGELAEALSKTTDDRAGTGPDFVPFAGGAKVTDATAPPVWAWYQPAVAPANPPFNFTFAVEGANPLRKGESFKLTGDSDKPVAVTLVEVQAEFVEVIAFGGERSPRATVDVTRNTPVSPKANGRLSPTIITANGSKPLFYLLYASPQASPHREPVVVRSKHKESAVWRVLPNEADAAADRSPPARQVARIEVKVVD